MNDSFIHDSDSDNSQGSPVPVRRRGNPVIDESYEEELVNIESIRNNSIPVAGDEENTMSDGNNESLNNNDDDVESSTEHFLTPFRRTPEEINDDRPISSDDSSENSSEIRDEDRRLQSFQTSNTYSNADQEQIISERHSI